MWSLSRSIKRIVIPPFWIALCCTLALDGCKDPHTGNRHPIAFNNSPVPAAEALPVRDDFRINRPSAATSTRDFFSLRRVIKLEATELSSIGRIRDFEFVNGEWIILDDGSNRIYRFQEDGTFSGLLGRTGQGPGEFGRPLGLAHWRDWIAVIDGERGNILVFRSDGAFVREISTRQLGIGATDMTFFKGDRMYVPNFAAWKADIPCHAILEFVDPDWRPLFGFGHRFAPAYQLKHYRHHHYSAFALVGDRVWSCSPYSSFPEIHDGDGRLLRQLVPGLDGQTEQDFAGLNTKESIDRRLQTKPSGFALVTLEKAVLFYLRGNRRFAMTIYDLAGNVIIANLTVHAFHYLNPQPVKGSLVTEVPLGYLNLDYIDESTDEREYQLILDAGFNPLNREDDNHTLFIWDLELQ